MTIKYVMGDATQPVGVGAKAIVHIVNDQGAFGAGFALALLGKWRVVEQSYRAWYRDDAPEKFELGNIQIVPVEENLYVVNMIAQHGFGKQLKPPIRYEALRQCLRKVDQALPPTATIHCPRIGAGLAGGSWAKIEAIMKEELVGRKVTVYDREGDVFNP